MATQESPSKHLPSPQSQVLIWWLSLGEHPHAPMRQLSGKSADEVQHEAFVT
jgi:hypothetical protein